MLTLLVIEDDKTVRNETKRRLEAEGYTVYCAQNGLDALSALDDHHIDLAVLDLTMPIMDGLTFLHELRCTENMLPVIIVSARKLPEDIKMGFIAGADDYMTKPTDYEELSLRIRAILRRIQSAYQKKLTVGAVILDRERLSVSCSGKEQSLPKKEFDLLYMLLSHPGRVFSRSQIMDEIWGLDSESEDITITTHVARLRKRFASLPDFKLVAVRGMGYKAVVF